AELAMRAKNEAVSLGALQRIDDLDGIVTQKELVRTRRGAQSSPQPMFMLPPGANIHFTVNQQNNTIGSGSESLHNVPSVTLDNPATTSSQDASLYIEDKNHG